MKKFFKLCALSIAAFSACLTANAHEFEISDFVINAGETKTISVYLTLDQDMNGGGFSMSVSAPTGYKFKNPVIGEAFADAQSKSAMVNKSGVLKFNAANANAEAGKVLVGTVDVSASATVTNAALTVKDLYVRVWVENEEEEWEYIDSYYDDQTVTINVLKDLTLNASGYTTYSVCAPVVVTGATVLASELADGVLTLTEAGTIVPANTGVILKGTGTASFVASEETADVASALTPAVVATTVAANSVLTLSPTEKAFYTYTGTEIPANKAYLENSASTGRIRIIEDDATGIQNINAESLNLNYNLMGQQVKTQKGILIENGQKVIKF